MKYDAIYGGFGGALLGIGGSFLAPKYVSMCGKG